MTSCLRQPESVACFSTASISTVEFRCCYAVLEQVTVWFIVITCYDFSVYIISACFMIVDVVQERLFQISPFFIPCARHRLKSPARVESLGGSWRVD